MSRQRPLKTYDLNAVYLLIGGYQIGGYGADGGIEVEWTSPIGEMTIGADGLGTFSRNNDASASVTITVMETSRSYRDLATLMQAQDAEESISALGFLLRDEVNGDEIAEEYPVFTDRPGVSKTKKAGERVFKLNLPSAALNTKFGSAIAV
jgi:hypothetical protein